MRWQRLWLGMVVACIGAAVAWIAFTPAELELTSPLDASNDTSYQLRSPASVMEPGVSPRVGLPSRPVSGRLLRVVLTGKPSHLTQRYEISASVRRAETEPGSVADSQERFHEDVAVLSVAPHFHGRVDIHATHVATGWRVLLTERGVLQGQDRLDVDLSLNSRARNAHNLKVHLGVPPELTGPFRLNLALEHYPATSRATPIRLDPVHRRATVWVHGLMVGSYVPIVESLGAAESYLCEFTPVSVRGDTEAELRPTSGGTIFVRPRGAWEGGPPGPRVEIRDLHHGRSVPHTQRVRADETIEMTGVSSGTYLLWVTSGTLTSHRVVLQLHEAWPRSLDVELGPSCRLSVRLERRPSTDLSIWHLETASEVPLTSLEVAMAGRARPVMLTVKLGTYRVTARLGGREVSRTVRIERPRASVVLH